MLRRFLATALLGVFTLLGVAPVAHAGDHDTAEITDSSRKNDAVVFAVSSVEQLDIDPRTLVVTAGDVVLESSVQPADGATDDVDIPRRVVYLVVDTSGSMAGEGIVAARDAGAAYLRAVPDDVRVGLVTFADEPRVVLRAAAERAPVRRALRNLRAVPGGATALYGALGTATTEMAGLPESAEKRLLVLSDGADTASDIGQQKAVRGLAQAGVPADVVSFQLPSGDQAVLDDIAEQTEGSAFAVGDSAALSEIFVEVAESLRPRLRVEAKVPSDLAGQTVELGVTARAGDRTVSGSAMTQLPGTAAVAADGTSPLETVAGAPSDRVLWMLVALVFFAVFAVSLASLYVPVLNAQVSTRQARLHEVTRYRLARAAAGPQTGTRTHPGENGELTNRALGFVERAMRGRGVRDKVGVSLDSAGLRMRPEEWAVLQVAGVLAGAAVGYVFLDVVGLAVGAVVASVGFRIFLRWRTNQRRDAFLEQIPDTLQLLAGSLRAGFSLQQALSTVVREGTEPTASEFTRALTEARLGADIEDALDAVAHRMRCQDLEWVVMAVRISREVGGNLAEVLSKTVGTMRERAELRGLVKVLSAEGRLSGKILMGLPVLVALAITFINPGYRAPLYQTVAGWVLLIGSAALMSVGAFWLSRMTKIEV